MQLAGERLVQQLGYVLLLDPDPLKDARESCEELIQAVIRGLRVAGLDQVGRRNPIGSLPKRELSGGRVGEAAASRLKREFGRAGTAAVRAAPRDEFAVAVRS